MRARPLAALLAAVCLLGARPAAAADYVRVVVLSDLHVSTENLKAEQAVISDVNSWDDVTAVALLGDLCQRRGTQEEFDRVTRLLRNLKKPALAVAGNHDYLYKDAPHGQGTPQERSAKLSRFQKALAPKGLDTVWDAGRYRLIFLSVRHLTSDSLAELTGAQLDWLDAQLSQAPGRPALVFFHAPLPGSLGKNVKAEAFAGPESGIRRVLAKHPQAFLWVSGHSHTSPANPKFVSTQKVFGQMHFIHNTDLGERRVTNSLYLYPDRVAVRTYDHKAQRWLEALAREFPVPASGQAASGSTAAPGAGASSGSVFAPPSDPEGAAARLPSGTADGPSPSGQASSPAKSSSQPAPPAAGSDGPGMATKNWTNDPAAFTAALEEVAQKASGAAGGAAVVSEVRANGVRSIENLMIEAAERLKKADPQKLAKLKRGPTAPVKGRILRAFGGSDDPELPSRKYKGKVYDHFNDGLDLAAASGAPVRVLDAGLVTHVAVDRFFGVVIVAAHPGGLTTAYAHLSKPLVQPGQYVAAGTVLGAAGETGMSSAPGLHFMARRDVLIDPAKVLP